MIAGLPMYDRPETAGALDRWWALIRDALHDAGLVAPAALDRGTDLWALWQAPDLVLAQTCGLPYRARLHGHVTLIGTPDPGLPGCPPGHYRSVFVVRGDDTRDTLAEFANARLAYNDPLSQSGWAAALAHTAKLGLRVRPVGPTGSHAASAQAVAEYRADIAAIDAVSWALACRHDAVAGRLRVIDATEPTPALPLIAAAGADRTATLTACRDALIALSTTDRDTLMMNGIVEIQPEAYLALPLPPSP